MKYPMLAWVARHRVIVRIFSDTVKGHRFAHTTETLNALPEPNVRDSRPSEQLLFLAQAVVAVAFHPPEREQFPAMLQPVPFDYLVGLALWIAVVAAALVMLLRARRNRSGQPRRLRWINVGLSLWMFVALVTACNVSAL